MNTWNYFLKYLVNKYIDSFSKAEIQNQLVPAVGSDGVAYFNMAPGDFFSVTLPLTAVSFIALVLASLPLLPKQLQEQQLEDSAISSGRHLAVYGGLFALCLLTVFRV